MKKNYLALLLGTALVTAMLGGCGDVTETVEVPQQVEESTEDTGDVEEPVDVQGKTEELNIAGNYVHAYEEEFDGEIVELSEAIILNDDFTCEVQFQDAIPGTYTADTISLDDGSEYTFTINGDELILDMDGVEVTFTKTELNMQEAVVDETVENDAVQMQFSFTTTDIEGNSVSLQDYAGAKLIMINFWEPWCGPCVNEMPDLEKLYEEYGSDGFIILGVFSTTEMSEDAKDILKSCGTTYPILEYVDTLEQFTTDYVPTTVFLDQNGNVLTDEPIIGANSYSDWKQIIEGYLYN